jgi:hypothetical protein
VAAAHETKSKWQKAAKAKANLSTFAPRASLLWHRKNQQRDESVMA